MLNVLVENSQFSPAQVRDAAAWRERYDLSFPVLADAQGAWGEVWGNPESRQYTQHSYTLLDPDGVVLWRRVENQTFDNTVLNLILAELERI